MLRRMRSVTWLRTPPTNFHRKMWRSVSSEGSDTNLDQEDDSESVSSVDEELIQWRQAIRESLERDLQVRVAERLNLDSAYLKLKNRMFPTRLRELRYTPGLIRYRTNSSIFEHSGRSEDISKARSNSTRELVGDDQRELAAVASKATTAAVELPRTIAADLTWPTGNTSDSVSIAHLSSATMKCSIGDDAPPLVDSKIRFHWPEETSIVLPTPQHSYEMSSTYEAMAFSRSSQLMASQFCRRSGEEKRWTVPELVYDRNGSITSPSQSPSPICLHFESRFESGNLLQAYRVASAEYDLVLQTDLFTRKHTQWFYFSVANVIQGITYTFNLVNFKKSDSLYNYGMQPLLYSEEAARQTGVGWSRVGHGVGYYRNLFNKYRTSPSDTVYYTLTWKMEFPYSDDLCYISHCYPYPYSQLYQWLLQLEQDHNKWCNVTKQVMCKSLAGNDVFLLTITERNASEEELQQRKGVILTARVHPGETNSSWMMQGAIEFLTSDHPSARDIRKLCVIKIVPMLNPDGVIVGNYRCSLAKADLNRVYRKPSKEMFPTVWHTKQMIESFLQEKGTKDVIAYVDLHGHSRKHNIFTYGCHMPGCNLEQLLEGRLLPWLLFQQCPEKFSFNSCKFSVHKCKESTGRVVMWRMGIANSFTLEATFCGTKLSPIPRHFTVDDYKAMGEDLCKVISNYAKYKHSKISMTGSLVNLALHLKASSQESDCMLSTVITQVTSTSSSSTSVPTQYGMPSEKIDSCSTQQQPIDIIKNCKIEDLENESTTSGSDTSNDEFGPCSSHKQLQRRSRKKKEREGKKSRKKRKVVKLSKSSSVTGNSPLTTTPLPQVEREKRSPHNINPIIKMPPFVNRYANRSNGGIPMFAEERLRERKAKKSETCLENSYYQNLPTSEVIETSDYHHISPSPIQFDTKLQKSQSPKGAGTQSRNTLTSRKSYSVIGNFEEHPIISTSFMLSKPPTYKLMEKKLAEQCNPSYNFLTSSDVTALLDSHYQATKSIGPQRFHHKTRKLGHNLNISTDDSSWYSLPSICQWKSKRL